MENGDYINREMAADCIVIECDDVTLEQARQAIKDCPSADVVEVVRCKDCKYYHKDAMMPVHPMLGGGTVIENHCDMSCMKLKDDDYCSYGERKYDDECK